MTFFSFDSSFAASYDIAQAATGMIITPTVHPTSTPPTIRLDVTQIPAGAVTTTITRSASGLPTDPVRGAKDASVVGSSITGIVDYEAPFGVPITYTVTAYGPSGAAIDTAQTVTLLDVDVMWLSDPLAPVISTPVRGVKAPESFQSITYTLNTAVTPVEGQELPVGLSGVRQAASSVPMTIICGPGESAPVRGVLRYAAPFLLRTPIRWQLPLPPLSYCLAQTVTETLFGGVYGWTHLSTTFDLVQPPGQNQALPPRTYGTLLLEATTYGDLPGLYTNYLDALLGST